MPTENLTEPISFLLLVGVPPEFGAIKFKDIQNMTLKVTKMLGNIKRCVTCYYEQFPNPMAGPVLTKLREN